MAPPQLHLRSCGFGAAHHDMPFFVVPERGNNEKWHLDVCRVREEEIERVRAGESSAGGREQWATRRSELDPAQRARPGACRRMQA